MNSKYVCFSCLEDAWLHIDCNICHVILCVECYEYIRKETGFCEFVQVCSTGCYTEMYIKIFLLDYSYIFDWAINNSRNIIVNLQNAELNRIQLPHIQKKLTSIMVKDVCRIVIEYLA